VISTLVVALAAQMTEYELSLLTTLLGICPVDACALSPIRIGRGRISALAVLEHVFFFVFSF